MKKTIALLILFAAIYTHSYTGNYCDKEKTTCIQINPNGKAELVVDKVNIIGSYTKTNDNFLITAKTAANQASKNLIVKKVKERLESYSYGSFDKRQALRNCEWHAENSKSIFGDGSFSYNGRHNSVAGCVINEEERWERGKQNHDASKQQRLKELKYSDELIGDFIEDSWVMGRNLILVGNTLHSPDGRCGSWLALTKSGSKETPFNDFNEAKQFCVKDVAYSKCGGKTYEPDRQGCENNIVLDKCGDSLYNEEKQFCANDAIYSKCSGKTYEPKEKGCCGAEIYPLKNKICENNIVFAKCGEQSYDPEKQFCLDGKLKNLNAPVTASQDASKTSSNTTKAPSSDVKTSTFKDQRDGKEYKSVKIGTQTWMAENLNYEAKGFLAKGTSKCYGNNSSNCASYGRLYDWDAALGACPKGWHLPSDEEWKQIAGSIGSNFSALPGGLYAVGRAGENGFYRLGEYGYWWTATPTANKNKSHQVGMNSGSRSLKHSTDDKSCLLSVRCIQD